MSDAETVDENGDRTVQSIVCKSEMTTEDDIEKVIAFYKKKLQPQKDEDDTDAKAEEQKNKSGRSVIIHDDSKDRPFAMHVILVNTDQSSTTLIITRGEKESKTTIDWKHYLRL